MPPAPDVSRKDVDLWMIYANKIRETYFAGQNVGPKNRIYIPPLNTQAIMAGDHVDVAITNYGVARTGDSLIAADNPMMTFSGETYSQKCLRYLYSVQLGGISDLGLEQIASDRKNEIGKKQAYYDQILEAAGKAFDKDRLKEADQTFQDWVVTRYPAFLIAENDLNGATNNYNAIMTQIYGPGFHALSSDIQKLAAACKPYQNSVFVMEVCPALIGAKDVKAGSKKYAPAYHIQEGYPTAVKGWIKRAADRDPPSAGFSFSSKDASNYSWEQVGHTTKSFNGSAGWQPLFSVDYTYNNEQKSDYVHANDQSTEFNFEVKALGIQTFEIGPDNSWLPQDLKKNYPRLFKNASKDLWDPMVRAAYVVVGYNVSITITMDKDTYDKIKGAISNASSHSGNATASLFGFKLDIGGKAGYTEENSTDYSNVKTNNEKYSFEIPASNNTLPVLLAVLGVEVASKNEPSVDN